MNDNLIKISIIVPIYNTPTDSLIACLDSIKNQAYLNYELILINDGSSLDLSRKYQELSQVYNALYLEQANKGVSSARNYGIQEATGDYIAFIDSDDTIMPSFLCKAADYAMNSGYDIVIGSIQDTSRNYSQAFVNTIVSLDRSDIHELELALLGGIGDHFKCNPKSYFLLGSSCGRIYKTSIIKNIRYQDGLKYSEDQLFNRIAFQKSNSALIVPDIWYNYLQNEFSAMHANYENYNNQVRIFWRLWNDITIKDSNSENIAAANILSLRWFNGYTSEWLIPQQRSLEFKINEMKALSKEDIFKNAVHKLSLKILDNFKDRLTYILLKFHLFMIIYLINSINRSLITKDSIS